MQYKVTPAGAGVIPKVERGISASLPKIQGSRPWENFRGDKLFLSQNGGSRIPFTPVSTDAERKLFSNLVVRFLRGSEGADFDDARMAQEWDNNFDGVNFIWTSMLGLGTFSFQTRL